MFPDLWETDWKCPCMGFTSPLSESRGVSSPALTPAFRWILSLSSHVSQWLVFVLCFLSVCSGRVVSSQETLPCDTEMAQYRFSFLNLFQNHSVQICSLYQDSLSKRATIQMPDADSGSFLKKKNRCWWDFVSETQWLYIWENWAATIFFLFWAFLTLSSWCRNSWVAQ